MLGKSVTFFKSCKCVRKIFEDNYSKFLFTFILYCNGNNFIFPQERKIFGSFDGVNKNFHSMQNY